MPAQPSNHRPLLRHDCGAPCDASIGEPDLPMVNARFDQSEPQSGAVADAVGEGVKFAKIKPE